MAFNGVIFDFKVGCPNTPTPTPTPTATPVPYIAVDAAVVASFSPGDVCNQTCNTFYTVDGDITTGNILYNGSYLPVTGFNYVCKCAGGIPSYGIYALDSSTGEIGAYQGSTCN